jgi:hypothetical protein
MANIQILHLLTGEDVIGDVNGIAPTTTSLKNPCVIILVPDAQNKERVGVQLRPLCPFSTDKLISINESAIIYRSTPVQELENQYNTLFGSGLVIAGSIPAKGQGGAPSLTRIK